MKFKQVEEVKTGKKTQTCRPIKRQPKYGVGEIISVEDEHGSDTGLFVKITKVRPEKLQEVGSDLYSVYREGFNHISNEDAWEGYALTTEQFQALWDSCYGDTEYFYETDPWVWVYEFALVKPDDGEVDG